MNIDVKLIAVLSPYLGAKGANAVQLLKKNPLEISQNQALFIDSSVMQSHISKLKHIYNSESDGKLRFQDIPGPAQTVIASVSFQYGVGLNIRTPKFWRAVTKQDWTESIKILRNFGDRYQTRRKKEAQLMVKIK